MQVPVSKRMGRLGSQSKNAGFASIKTCAFERDGLPAAPLDATGNTFVGPNERSNEIMIDKIAGTTYVRKRTLESFPARWNTL
jgi:hypothetical protein